MPGKNLFLHNQLPSNASGATSGVGSDARCKQVAHW